MTRFVLVFAAFLLGSVGAIAQTVPERMPEIVVNDGYAFSWKENEKVVVYDVVSAWTNMRGAQVADCSKHQTKFKGAVWCFQNQANLKVFLAKTDKRGENEFVPFVGGRCTLGVSWGRLQAMGHPRSARIVKGDLGPILVLHSDNKWWPTFHQNMFTRMEIARLRFDIAKEHGRIVPNEKVK